MAMMKTTGCHTEDNATPKIKLKTSVATKILSTARNKYGVNIFNILENFTFAPHIRNRWHLEWPAMS